MQLSMQGTLSANLNLAPALKQLLTLIYDMPCINLGDES